MEYEWIYHGRLNNIDLGKSIQTVYTYKQREELCFNILEIIIIIGHVSSKMASHNEII